MILDFLYFALKTRLDHHHLLHNLSLLVDLILLHAHFIETFQRRVLVKLALNSQDLRLGCETLKCSLKLIDSYSILL